MIATQTAEAIVVSRSFDAPRALVFEVFTQPEHLQQWFAPKNFTVPYCTVDLRPGGIFHFCMRAPDGREFWSRGVFQEIVVPELLVYVDSFSDAQGNLVPPSAYGLSESHPAESEVRITFEQRGEETVVTLRHELSERVKERSDAQQGWMEMFERAADVVLQARIGRIA
ncbi:MAG TPA: SRPBCC domain-containing protein [Thermoanaerobaculia bacterium]|nr:SRPBCC domain-containing protein [Thermoanaerobaculia bacterium]